MEDNTKVLDEMEKTIFRIQNGTTLTYNKTEVQDGIKVISLMKTPRQRKSTYVKKDPSQWKKNGRPPGSKDKAPRAKTVKPKKLSGLAKAFAELPEEHRKQVEEKAGGTITLDGDSIIVTNSVANQVPEELEPLADFLIDTTSDKSLDNVEEPLEHMLDRLNKTIDTATLAEREESEKAQKRVYKGEKSNRGRPKGTGHPKKPKQEPRCAELHKLRDDRIYQVGGYA